jgi:hypothetical protein
MRLISQPPRNTSSVLITVTSPTAGLWVAKRTQTATVQPGVASGKSSTVTQSPCWRWRAPPKRPSGSQDHVVPLSPPSCPWPEESATVLPVPSSKLQWASRPDESASGSRPKASMGPVPQPGSAATAEAARVSTATWWFFMLHPPR